MKDIKLIIEFIEDLNLINWLVVVICVFIVVSGVENEFVKYVALTALPTGGQALKRFNNKVKS